MALQTGQFKSQTIIESILKSILSLLFALTTIIMFVFVISSMGFKYDISQILQYTVIEQLPHSLSGNDINTFLQNFILVIFWASPLVLTGLSVAIAFKCGLFNIGGQGQMIMGGLFAGVFGAVLIPQTPILNSIFNTTPIIMIPTILLISMLFGAIWAGIPGFLRAYTGAHEVITTIFMNQIAINLANYLVGRNDSLFVDKSGANVYNQTATISKNAQILPISIDYHLNLFGFHYNLIIKQFSTYFNWSIFIILLVVIVVHYLIWNTSFGFQIRATGYNKTASEVSGINTKRSILYAMLLAGALAGLAGGLNVVAISPYKYVFGSEGTSGFDGIAVSLIGLNSPLPIVPASLLFGFLHQGRILLDSNTNISSHIVVILQSFVVIFAAAPYISARIYKASKDLLKGDKSIAPRFKSWFIYNEKSIIVSIAFLVIPYGIFLIFRMFHIDIWEYMNIFDVLMNINVSFRFTLIVMIIALIVLFYSTYKLTRGYVASQKAKNKNIYITILKLVIFFLIAIEVLIVTFYILVIFSGYKIDFIRFHDDVWARLLSPVTIRGMIVAAFPIIMGAIGGSFNERAGVINIGLEGIMLTSAFGSVYMTYVTGNPYMGILGGLLFGFLTALLHAVLTITFKAEQVVTGVGINLLALGLTDFLTTIVWHALRSTTVNKLPFLNLQDASSYFGVNLLDFNIPIIGPILQILSTQSILLFFGILLIPICHIILFKTPFGLRLRVIGEEPSAAATAGIPVQRYQYFAVLISGLLTSIGGIYLAIGDSSYFQSNMTGGRGYTALAAMIFGKWTISGGVLSGLFFGYFYSLAINLQSLDYFSNIYRILNMMPFVIAIMVLAGAIGLARPPKSIGKTYDPQS